MPEMTYSQLEVDCIVEFMQNLPPDIVGDVYDAAYNADCSGIDAFRCFAQSCATMMCQLFLKSGGFAENELVEFAEVYTDLIACKVANTVSNPVLDCHEIYNRITSVIPIDTTAGDMRMHYEKCRKFDKTTKTGYLQLQYKPKKERECDTSSTSTSCTKPKSKSRRTASRKRKSASVRS